MCADSTGNRSMVMVTYLCRVSLRTLRRTKLCAGRSIAQDPHGDVRVEARQGPHRCDLVVVELLVGREVFGLDGDDVVGMAEHAAEVRDSVGREDECLEAVDGVGVVRGHVGEDRDAEPAVDLGGVDDSGEAADDAALGQPLDPLQTRRRAEPNPFGELEIRNATVALKLLEDVQVDRVHSTFYRKTPIPQSYIPSTTVMGRVFDTACCLGCRTVEV